MRVVLATNQFPKFSETFIARQFLGLLERGWDMHVVCPSSDPAQWDFYPELRDRPELRERVHVTRDYHEAVASLAPALVHFEFGAVAVGRASIAAEVGSRMLVSFRGYDVNMFGVEDPHCYDEVWARADAVHTVSQDVWRRVQRRGCPAEMRHEVIYDAVDAAAFTGAGRVYTPVVGTAARPLRILSVGRLLWKKGYEFGLEAVRRVVDAGVHCEYRIVGEGEHREAVLYTIDDLGLGGVVRLEGARPGASVREALRWGDVLLHSAVTEGFCVAALEAQATGLPVVCSDAGGLPENVAHGETGIVVPRRDPAATADALLALAGNAALRQRMGRRGRRRAETFGYDEQHRRFDALYRSLLAEPAAPAPVGGPTAKAQARQDDVERVRAALARGVPADARVLVVSRGDDDLVAFAGWRTGHFPQDDGGRYAGFHPADSGEAIGHLEHLRAAGAEYLVFPPTGRWWLEHYEGLRMHLERTGRMVPSPAGDCVVFALGAR